MTALTAAFWISTLEDHAQALAEQGARLPFARRAVWAGVELARRGVEEGWITLEQVMVEMTSP